MQPIPDDLEYHLGLTEYLIVPETQHLDAFPGEPSASPGIIAGLAILGVPTAIQFDGQLFLHAVEIQDIGTDRPLALELDSGHPAIAQHKPQQRLGVGLVAS